MTCVSAAAAEASEVAKQRATDVTLEPKAGFFWARPQAPNADNVRVDDEFSHDQPYGWLEHSTQLREGGLLIGVACSSPILRPGTTPVPRTN